jgi:hypothetical protein
MNTITSEQSAFLTILANAVIPSDEIDRGAAEVGAGPVLAAKVAAGINAAVYLKGVDTAAVIAQEQFDHGLPELNPEQVHQILMELKRAVPGFYKQLRADVCALYLSEPAVWQLIGFPGPSAHTGGYPDFDQPQFLYKKQ